MVLLLHRPAAVISNKFTNKQIRFTVWVAFILYVIVVLKPGLKLQKYKADMNGWLGLCVAHAQCVSPLGHSVSHKTVTRRSLIEHCEFLWWRGKGSGELEENQLWNWTRGRERRYGVDTAGRI